MSALPTDPDFPEWDERGWPTAIIGLVLSVRDDAVRLHELSAALRSTNSLRANEVQQLAWSIENAALTADRYMDKTPGPHAVKGAAPSGAGALAFGEPNAAPSGPPEVDLASDAPLVLACEPTGNGDICESCQ